MPYNPDEMSYEKIILISKYITYNIIIKIFWRKGKKEKNKINRKIPCRGSETADNYYNNQPVTIKKQIKSIGILSQISL